jgi:fimbrial chaperone protein
VRHPFRFFLALALLTCAVFTAHSFTFEPITRDFAPSGRDSIQTFKITNNGPESIAVRVAMLSRLMDENGRETYAPADALFVTYPSRVVLEPNGVQAVRIQWKGPSEISSELCFRILAEQLPVDFGGEKAQGGSIKVLFRYLGAVYILPAGVSPDVAFVSARPAVNEEGAKGIELVLENRGTAHTLLNDLEITLTAKGGQPLAPKKIGPEDLSGINGENMLPGAKRRFFLAVPEELRREDLDVAIRFEASR